MMLKNLPLWVWSGIICLIVGAAGGGGLVIQTTKSNSTESTVNCPEPKSPLANVPAKDLEDLRIVVTDSQTKNLLGNVNLRMTFKQGIVPGRTLDDGTYRFQAPKQELGEITILLNKQGYQQKEIPLNFSINPNQPRPIELEPINSSSNLTDENTSVASKNSKTVNENEYNPKAEIKAKSEYTEGEPIEVTYSFSDVPSNYQKIVRVAAASTPEDSIGIYRANVGNSGSVKFSGLKPGEYKIRTFYMYQPWQFKLISETPFIVK